jgi:hypothetical protein
VWLAVSEFLLSSTANCRIPADAVEKPEKVTFLDAKQLQQIAIYLKQFQTKVRTCWVNAVIPFPFFLFLSFFLSYLLTFFRSFFLPDEGTFVMVNAVIPLSFFLSFCLSVFLSCFWSLTSFCVCFILYLTFEELKQLMQDKRLSLFDLLKQACLELDKSVYNMERIAMMVREWSWNGVFVILV